MRTSPLLLSENMFFRLPLSLTVFPYPSITETTEKYLIQRVIVRTHRKNLVGAEENIEDFRES
jgi:hypothetical protein